MEKEEIAPVIAAVLIFTAILALRPVIHSDYAYIGTAFVSAAVIIAANIYGKKLMAHWLDIDVVHRTWQVTRFGFKPHKHLQNPFLAGIFFPLILAVISGGAFKLSTFLTYEATAKKVRAAKRFGYYSYASMTDWHNALVGAAGIISTLLVLVVSYLAGFEPMAKAAAFYAFWNMFPVSDLDGTQIYFGSRILWIVLAILSFLAAMYSVAII